MQAKKLFDFNERRTAAEDARKATAEKFKALKSRLDDPAVQQKLAEQKVVAEAREQRQAERAAAKAAELARIAAERREADKRAAEDAVTARVAEIDAQNRAVILDAEKKARALAMAGEQKAKRDARYAARKQRTK